MKLEEKPFALASALVSSVVSFTCVVLIALIPAQTMNVFGWLIHAKNFSAIVGAREVDFLNAAAGIAVFTLLGYFVGWLFAVFYNKFAKTN